MPVHLALDLEADDGPLITLSGEVDMLVADDLRGAGESAIAQAGADGRKRVVIDLREVTFLDSTGIGALVAISNAAGTAGVPLVLRAVSPRISKLLAITGLDGVFATEP